MLRKNVNYMSTFARMKRRNYRVWLVLLGPCLAGTLGGCSRVESKPDKDWNPKSATTYLEQRETWWMSWSVAARDHDTFCISCHTVLPYALLRATNPAAFRASSTQINEQRILDNVAKRVRLWQEVSPYYTDRDDGAGKTAESRGTEAVLNALILASHDAACGRLSADTRSAFANMWAQQQTTGENRGAWSWLNFGNSPWEGASSQYFGATLAALAAGTAPDNYRSTRDIQENLKLLHGYLSREYSRQPLSNRVLLLYASTKLPDLIKPEQRDILIREVLRSQEEDGGWSLSTLQRSWSGSSLWAYARSWVRKDGTLVERKSDGYATGLVVFVLHQVGIAGDNVQLARGLDWLEANQDKTDGSWPAYSLNKRRNPSSNIGHFMNDAATAYAELALIQSGRRPSPAESALAEVR